MKIVSVVKGFGVLVGGLLLMSLAGVIIFLATSDPNQYKGQIVSKLDAAIEGQVNIAGPIDFKLWPWPRIHVQQFSVSRVTEKGTPYSIAAKDLQLNVGFSVLFSSDFAINDLLAQGVTLQLGDNKPWTIDMLNGNFKSTCCGLKSSKFILKAKGSTFKGHFDLDLDKPHFLGKLNVDKLDVGLWTRGESASQTPAFPFGWFGKGTIDFQLGVAELMHQGKSYQNIKTHVFSKEGKVHLDPIQVTNKEDKFKGSALINPLKDNQGQITLKGSYQSKAVDKVAMDLILEPNKTTPSVSGSIEIGTIKDKSLSKVEMSERLIPKWIIPFELIEQRQLDVSLSINAVDNRAQNIVANVRSDGRTLRLEEFKAQVLGGQLSGSVALTPQSKTVRVDLKADDLLLNQIVKPQSGKAPDGKLDFILKGQGRGDDLQQVFGAWNGHVLTHLKKARLYHRRVDNDFGQFFFGFLQPRKQNKQTPLECFVLKAPISNGVVQAQNRIGLETSDLNVMGSGTINLNNEALDINVAVTEKRGIDLKLGDFDKYVVIKGTLTKPNINFRPDGVVKEGVSILGAIATGGLSLVAQQLMSSMEGSSQPCKSVMESK